MPELKLGTKHECYSCGTKFYDLGKPEALCPKCGANQKDVSTSETPAASQASRRRRKAEISKSLDVDEDVPLADLDEEIVPDADLDGAALDDDEDEDEDFDDEE
ncbi:MAG TPA: TIGR02300 family protein [Acidobacteria bacterium]|nr:TIGR02300 family protein [Acidobacteriota bacterium]